MRIQGFTKTLLFISHELVLKKDNSFHPILSILKLEQNYFATRTLSVCIKGKP